MKPGLVVLLLLGGAGDASAQDSTGAASAPEAGLAPRYAQLALARSGAPADNAGVGDAAQTGMLFGRQAVGATARGLHYYDGDAHPVAPASADIGSDGAGPSSTNRAWGVSFGLEQGALTLRAAHQNRAVAPVAPATPMGNSTQAKNSLLSANLRLGVGTAYVAYSVNRGWGSSPLFNPDNPYGASMAATSSTDSRDVLVGMAVPSGAATWLASYVRKNDRDLANRDAAQLALGASYALSRRTDVYGAYSRIHNAAGARAFGDAALNLGLRHAF